MYINFFQPTLKGGAAREFTVMMINDEDRPRKGRLTLALVSKSTGQELARAEQPFAIDALGSQTYKLTLSVPATAGGAKAAGDCILRAAARPEGDGDKEPTVCRRWVKVGE